MKRPAVIVDLFGVIVDACAPRTYRLRGSEPNVQNLPLRPFQRKILEEWRSSLPPEAQAFAESLQPLKPHPIVKLGAELAAELTPAELDARRELRYLARRWERKLRPPLLVANKLRQQGALWRLKGVGAC